MKTLTAALLIATLWPAQSFGQSDAPASAPGWFDVVVPGMLSGLAHAAELPTDRLEAAFAATQIIHTLRSTIGTNRRELDHLEAYFSALEQLSGAIRLFPDGKFSLSGLEDKQRRNRVEAVINRLGLRLNFRARGRNSVSPAKGQGEVTRQLLTDGGVDIEKWLDALNRGETITLSIPTITLPMPAPLEWWRRIVPTAASTSLMHVILLNETASFLYYGLCALDPDTRKWAIANPKFLDDVTHDAAVFARFAGSLRVRDGAIVVPGGSQAVPFWEDLIDAKTTAPDQFIQQLLSKDDGRIAYIYGSLAGLPAASITFALNLQGSSDRRQIHSHADAVHDWLHFDAVSWQLPHSPFSRPQFDPIAIPLLLDVTDEGMASGPAWPYLWNLVFESQELPVSLPKHTPQGGSADADFFVASVFSPNRLTPQIRLQTILFAQRVFGSTLEASVSDLLIALRGFTRFPMLALTLERMGIRASGLYAAASLRAAALSETRDAETAFAVLSEFQGALLLIERATFTGRLTSDAASVLVQSLVSLSLESNGTYGRQIASWIEHELMPALNPASIEKANQTSEQLLVMGLSGIREVRSAMAPAAPERSVVFERYEYRVDPSAEFFERISTIRQRQSGNSLDTIVAVNQITAALEADEVRQDQIATHAKNLRQLLEQLKEPPQPHQLKGLRHFAVLPVLRRSITDLQKISITKQAKEFKRIGFDLDFAIESLTADALRSIAYAICLGDPDSELLLTGDVSYTHDLGVTEQERLAREQVAWSLPHEVVGTAQQLSDEPADLSSRRRRAQSPVGNWHVRGSLLALDIGLVPLTLRRVVAELPQTAPFWGAPTFGQTVALFNPFRLSDDSARSIAEALRKGRQQVDAGIVGKVDLEQSAPQTAPIRRELLQWASAHDRASVARLVSANELVAWGGGIEALHAAELWSATSFPLTGCLCLSLRPYVDWDLFSGRPETDLMPSRFPDILMRLAEIASDLDLPPAVVADILPAFVQAALNGSGPIEYDDWLAGVLYAADIDRRAVEDRVSAITTGHSLTAIGAIVK